MKKLFKIVFVCVMLFSGYLFASKEDMVLVYLDLNKSENKLIIKHDVEGSRTVFDNKNVIVVTAVESQRVVYHCAEEFIFEIADDLPSDIYSFLLSIGIMSNKTKKSFHQFHIANHKVDIVIDGLAAQDRGRYCGAVATPILDLKIDEIIFFKGLNLNDWCRVGVIVETIEIDFNKKKLILSIIPHHGEPSKNIEIPFEFFKKDGLNGYLEETVKLYGLKWGW